MNEMKLILKSGKPKRLMGLIVHHDGFKPYNSLDWQRAVRNLSEIEANINLLVSLTKRLEAPWNYVLK